MGTDESDNSKTKAGILGSDQPFQNLYSTKHDVVDVRLSQFSLACPGTTEEVWQVGFPQDPFAKCQSRLTLSI
jgi:hypothetical protein